MFLGAAAEQYAKDGYCVLPGLLDDDELDALRRGAEVAVARLDRQLDEAGVDVLGRTRRGLQYFPSNCFRSDPALAEFVTGPRMGELAGAMLDDDVYFFWEQFAVKRGLSTTAGPRQASFANDGAPLCLGSFSWHQDSAYVPTDHAPFLTCWIALDDVDEDNGCLHVLPVSAAGTALLPHVEDPANGDLVGYFGDETGVALELPAGSVVCFSSLTFHSSAPNLSHRDRRAFLVQYSPEPIASPGDPTAPLNCADPVVLDGSYVGGAVLR